MSQKTEITNTGAIRLGKYVSCDGFDETRPLRIVTHAHADHTTGLKQSLNQCESVLMTPATRDLLSVMLGPLFLMQGKVETLGYQTPLRYGDTELTLHFADHILGAAQVLVVEDNTRILYTGDFRLQKTPIIEADILVIEATYGNPLKIRNFEKEVRKTLVSLVEKALNHGPVYIFGYYGKLQEVMHILCNEGVKTPFIMPEKVFHVSKIYEKYGVQVGRCMLENDPFAKAILEKKDACIVFHHMATKNKVAKDMFRICVSGWEFNTPCRKIAEKEYIIALSDHADFMGLLQYVKACNPKLVITDNYRVGYAVELAKEIEKRLNIKAKPLPK